MRDEVYGIGLGVGNWDKTGAPELYTTQPNHAHGISRNLLSFSSFLIIRSIAEQEFTHTRIPFYAMVGACLHLCMTVEPKSKAARL